MAPETAALLDELGRRAEAVATDEDEARLSSYLEARETLLGGLGPAPGPGGGPAIRRLLELDRRVLGVLEARRAALREEIRRLTESRRLLAGYRGPAPSGPLFVERTG